MYIPKTNSQLNKQEVKMKDLNKISFQELKEAVDEMDKKKSSHWYRPGGRYIPYSWSLKS